MNYTYLIAEAGAQLLTDSSAKHCKTTLGTFNLETYSEKDTENSDVNRIWLLRVVT